MFVFDVFSLSQWFFFCFQNKAPEVVNQEGYSFATDVWSFGCLVLEMVTGSPPWQKENAQENMLFAHIGSSDSTVKLYLLFCGYFVSKKTDHLDA